MSVQICICHVSSTIATNKYSEIHWFVSVPGYIKVRDCGDLAALPSAADPPEAHRQEVCRAADPHGRM